MRLYINCYNCQCRIYLASNANSRFQLAQVWGRVFSIQCPNCGANYNYSVNQVYAEKATERRTIPIAILGGLIGLFGGPTGVLAGSTVGGILGNSIDEKEEILIKKFNTQFV